MQFVNSAKRLVFALTEIPFLKCLINIYRLIAKVLNNQNLFTESNLGNRFSSYVQFCSGGHFSKRAEAALWCGKMNHLNTFHSTIFDIPMRPLCEDQRHRRRFTR